MAIDFELPKLRIHIAVTEYGKTFTLYVNEEYEGTYPTKEDLSFRIGLINQTEINRRMQ